MENETKKKKGFFSMIWESMTKTGGCCGSGQTCCGPATEDDDKGTEDKNTEESNS